MEENMYASKIANKLNKWEVNYYCFGLSPTDVQDIKEIRDPRLQRIEVLTRWIESSLGTVGDLLKICADTEMSDCAIEIVDILNSDDDKDSVEHNEELHSGLGETPIEDSKGPKIQTPKAAFDGLDYKSFCSRVQYVFCTVNKNEFNAATTVISSPDIEVDKTQLTKYEDGIYVGMINDHPVGLIRHGPGRGCADMLTKGIKCFLNAKFVIGVGVCYGFKREELKFADVLISDQIQDLGPFRITKDDIQPRGPIGDMTNEIKAVFGNPDQVEGLKVSSDRHARHLVGKIASCNILIDYAKLTEKIYNAVGSKSLGGEMEGGEMLNLQLKGVTMPDGSNKKVDVIIIKAVVDYADGEKNKVWQFIGARAAFHYIQKKMAIVSGAE